MLLAHLSDIHIGGSVQNAERAARVMAYLSALQPTADAVLVTGDITHHGRTEEYDTAREILTCRFPLMSCPGNHDVRWSYRTSFLRVAGDDGPVNQVFDSAQATFALCDSSVPGQLGGLLDDTTVDWLDHILADGPASRPAFVCLHHPPIFVHSPELDAIRLMATDRLAELISRHSRVTAILCGHAHAAVSGTFAGVPVRVAPGVASSLRLPWEPGDLLDSGLPPALAFHVLDDSGQLTTHYRTVV